MPAPLVEQFVNSGLKLGHGLLRSRSQLSSLTQEPASRTMPARTAGLMRLTAATLRRNRVPCAGAGGAGNPEDLSIKLPGAGLQVKRGLIEGIEPGLVLLALDTSGLESSSDVPTIDQSRYTCIGHNGLASFVAMA